MTNHDQNEAAGNADNLDCGADADYVARRRALVKKLAAGAIATPVVLSSVTAHATRISGPLPPT